MKRTVVIALTCASLCLGGAALAAKQNAKHTPAKTDKGQLSYTIGYDMGSNFKRLDINLDPAMVNKGLQDGLQGNPSTVSKQDMQQTMVTFQKELIAKRMALVKANADKNAKAGSAFLAQNKSEEGVVTLPNGLQYKVLAKGKGTKPGSRDIVTVDYEGKTVAGKVFDSSYQRGKPVTFTVSDVIPAWNQALQKMRVGATWMVYAPAKLAYGEQGIGPIGPNETLIFKIHLLSVKKPENNHKKS